MAGSPDADAAAARLRISVELAQRFIPAQSDYGLSAMDQSIAGATAKASTKLALYPLDTWKSRRQAASTLNLRGLWSVAGVYRGVVPKIVLYTPYQAVYMATYTRARDILVAEGSPVYGSNLAFVCAGVSAEIAGSLVCLPTEVWKLRLQLGVYKSTRHAMQDFFRNPWNVYGNFVLKRCAADVGSRLPLQCSLVVGLRVLPAKGLCEPGFFRTRGARELGAGRHSRCGECIGDHALRRSEDPNHRPGTRRRSGGAGFEGHGAGDVPPRGRGDFLAGLCAAHRAPGAQPGRLHVALRGSQGPDCGVA